ncbi:ATP synthase subunit I [Thermodesulfobacteriota bacterium]
MDWETIYRDIRRRNWIILLILSSTSYFLMSQANTTGIILGGLIIIANFKVFQHTICRAFSHQGMMKMKKASIIVKYYFRLLALGILIYILINSGWVDPVGLAIGLSTVVISIVSFGVNSAWKDFNQEAT